MKSNNVLKQIPYMVLMKEEHLTSSSKVDQTTEYANFI
jgi:hypothetical protein